MLNGTTLQDKLSTKNLLEKANMLSVNQLKLIEIWKSLICENYPLSVEKQSERINRSMTRAYSNVD